MIGLKGAEDMCKRYVKKPIAVEAIQWIGLNKEDMIKFSKDINFVVHEDANTTINKLVIHTLGRFNTLY